MFHLKIQSLNRIYGKLKIVLLKTIIPLCIIKEHIIKMMEYFMLKNKHFTRRIMSVGDIKMVEIKC